MRNKGVQVRIPVTPSGVSAYPTNKLMSFHQFLGLEWVPKHVYSSLLLLWWHSVIPFHATFLTDLVILYFWVIMWMWVILESGLWVKESGWGLGRSLNLSYRKAPLRNVRLEIMLWGILSALAEWCCLDKIQTTQLLKCQSTQKYGIFTDVELVSSVDR